MKPSQIRSITMSDAQTTAHCTSQCRQATHLLKLSLQLPGRRCSNLLALQLVLHGPNLSCQLLQPLLCCSCTLLCLQGKHIQLRLTGVPDSKAAMT